MVLPLRVATVAMMLVCAQRHGFAAQSSTVQPAAGGPDGWDVLQIEKSDEELARDRADVADTGARPAAPVRLPPARETMGLSIGAGVVTRGGAAADVTGSGTIAGFAIDFSTFVVSDGAHTDTRSGRISIISPGQRWVTEAGDLLSETRGFARGVRVTRRSPEGHFYGASLYAGEPTPLPGRPAASLRAQRRLTGMLDVRGEILSDRSGSAGLRAIVGRANGEVLLRRSIAGRLDTAVSGGFRVWRAVGAYGALRVLRREPVERSALAGLSVSLPRQASVALEQTITSRALSSSTARALAVRVPAGRVQLMQRFTWTGAADRAVMPLPLPDFTQAQSVLSYTVSSRLRVNYQSVSQWLVGQDARQWNEVEGVAVLSRHSSLRVAGALPGGTRTGNQLRIGYRHDLTNRLALSVDVGSLPPFQSTTAVEINEPRVMTMLRRSWSIATPAAGGDVAGAVLDETGRGVAGVTVSLGPWLVETDAQGRYRFPHVPSGGWELGVVGDRLPAGFAAAPSSRRIVVRDNRDVAADLDINRLGVIRGLVYVDRNGNNAFDSGEGVEHVVVRLGSETTATMSGPAGAFAFSNVPAGEYDVWIDSTRLAANLEPASDARVLVRHDGIAAGTPVAFRLRLRQRPLLLKELP